MRASSSAVSQAPFELIRLIKEAERRDPRSREQIVAAAGLKYKTVEGWLSGAIKSPPLLGMARLCLELNIPPVEVFRAALELGDDEVRRLHRAVVEELAKPQPDREDPPGTPVETD